MKRKEILIILFLVVLISGCSANSSDPTQQNREISQSETESSMEVHEKHLKLTIGTKGFILEVDDTDTVKALEELLPLTLNFTELNDNEYYANLEQNLPTAPEKIGSIETGDFMLYNANCLVLFYDSFSTGYSYTPLGKVVDPTDLKEALALDDRVNIDFE